VLRPGIDGVVLPKVESAADLHAIDWLMANLERERGLAVGSIDLIPIIETAVGMQRIDRVVQARGLRPYEGRWRVRRLAFGAADYAAEVGLAPGLDEVELMEARARVVLASRAAGLEGPLDSPWFHLRESEAFMRALGLSRRMGFQGRLCIHPDQVAAANAAYAPSAEEIARAERIVAAFEAAEASGAAAIQVDGQMVDYPVAHRARAVLEAAREMMQRS
jgi:citrate lyase subunit beta/citryl-CoA lyase